jgi:hypothetical protein
MDQTQQAPIAAHIPAGQTAEQRIGELKADSTFNQRLVSGDKAAEAELLALMRHANKHPAAAPRTRS